jgi:hypothetical protein
MRSKIIALMLLGALFVGLLGLANSIKKDGANLENIPSITADSTPSNITIEGLNTLIYDSEGRLATESALYDFVIKYDESPKESYQAVTASLVDGVIDENGVITSRFIVRTSDKEYSVVYKTDPGIWIQVSITDELKNNYTQLRNISVSSI